MSQGTITVATLQPHLARHAPAENFEAVRRLLGSRGSQGPLDLIVLPEVFDGTIPELDEQLDAERSTSQAQDFLRKLATDTGAHVVGGSIAYRVPGEKIVNACFVVDRSGRIVGEYRKRRLFGPEAVCRQPGDAPGAFDLGDLRVGVLICADLWFPELARELTADIDLLCVPAKTTVEAPDHVEYAQGVWWSMAMTRATENGLPVVVSDWSRGGHDIHYTSGVSSITDPSGRPHMQHVQRRLQEGQEGVIVAQVDLDAVEQIRQYRRSVGLLASTEASRGDSANREDRS